MNKWILLLIIGTICYWLFFIPDNSNYSEEEQFAQSNEDSSIEGETEKPIFEIPEKIDAIYFSEQDLEYLNNKYLSENQEFRICLYGKTHLNNSILIISKKEPKYYSRNYLGVTAEDCDYHSVGFIHSHPKGNCLPSEEDKQLTQRQQFPVQGIICGEDRITFYTKESVNSFIKVYSQSLDGNVTEIKVKNPCPTGDKLCNGECFHGCTSQGTWRCLSTGGDCLCRPGVNSCNL
jgi:proteasome lid subunit RPN8/RPN11